MSIWFYLFLASLIISLILILKLYLMKNEIKNIESSFSELIKLDTNKLLTTNGGSKELQKLVNSLNESLKNLRKLELEYKNGNSELKKTITNISHDLRTPLTAISGYIDLIKESKDKSKNEEYLIIIERKTDELISLTENLFDFVKTVDIGEKIEKNNYSINEILEESLANFYSIFKEKSIEPEIEICEEKIIRNINKASMIRVFENIFSNTVKYSNGDFKVKLEKDGKITFSNKATTLDYTTVQKIFDRYFTLENAKKSNGLGLSIAKQLVELNGGKIFANYIKGKLVIKIEI